MMGREILLGTGTCLAMDRYGDGVEALALAAAASSSPEAAVIATEKEWLAAAAAANVARLEALLAEDAIYIRADGSVESKSSYIARIERGEGGPVPTATRQHSARIVGDTAITRSLVERGGALDAARVVRNTGIYVWRRHMWQLVSWQATPAFASAE